MFLFFSFSISFFFFVLNRFYSCLILRCSYVLVLRALRIFLDDDDDVDDIKWIEIVEMEETQLAKVRGARVGSVTM